MGIAERTPANTKAAGIFQDNRSEIMARANRPALQGVTKIQNPMRWLARDLLLMALTFALLEKTYEIVNSTPATAAIAIVIPAIFNGNTLNKEKKTSVNNPQKMAIFLSSTPFSAIT